MLCVLPPLLYNHNQFHTPHTHSPRHTNTLLTFDHIKMHKIKQSTIKSKRTVLVCVCVPCYLYFMGCHIITFFVVDIDENGVCITVHLFYLLSFIFNTIAFTLES